jgi:glycerophosphoryl diester phosphodiesterase
MNLSYSHGFRLLELDISKTADGHYVATHDWRHWAGITGYQGSLPPSRKSFLQQKLHGKFTPLDMAGINAWFKAHPDAILVTDKVNTPEDFASQFVDKTRLMMELFSWDAVEAGIKAGIKSAMPTGDILNRIQGDKIAYLKKLGVTDIASSRRILNREKSLVEKLTASGIRIFAFHVNFDEGIDETYVVCKERKYFYGMYADEWNFMAEPDCSAF